MASGSMRVRLGSGLQRPRPGQVVWWVVAGVVAVAAFTAAAMAAGHSDDDSDQSFGEPAPLPAPIV